MNPKRTIVTRNRNFLCDARSFIIYRAEPTKRRMSSFIQNLRLTTPHVKASNYRTSAEEDYLLNPGDNPLADDNGYSYDIVGVDE